MTLAQRTQKGRWSGHKDRAGEMTSEVGPKHGRTQRATGPCPQRPDFLDLIFQIYEFGPFFNCGPNPPSFPIFRIPSLTPPPQPELGPDPFELASPPKRKFCGRLWPKITPSKNGKVNGYSLLFFKNRSNLILLRFRFRPPGGPNFQRPEVTLSKAGSHWI